MEKKIVIRCDGARLPEIGTGHIMRSVALATALIESKTILSDDILFVTRNDEGYELGNSLLKATKFQVLDFSNQKLIPNSISEANILSSFSSELIILDRLKTTTAFMNCLRKNAAKIVTFDDLGGGRKKVDLAINAIFFNVPNAPNVLKGYDYLILSQQNIKQKQNISDEVENIFVSFGGFDKRDLNKFFIDCLPKINGHCTVNIILSTVTQKEKIAFEKKINSYRGKILHFVNLCERPDNFFESLTDADLAIVSGGLTAFEAVARGIPAVSIPQYPHQSETLKFLDQQKVIQLGLDNMKLDMSHFVSKVNHLIRSYERRKLLSLNGKNLINGRGLARVSEAILGLLKKEIFYA